MQGGHEDQSETTELVQFGPPLGIDYRKLSNDSVQNHTSANKNPAGVYNYFSTEVGHVAIVGSL